MVHCLHHSVLGPKCLKCSISTELYILWNLLPEEIRTCNTLSSSNVIVNYITVSCTHSVQSKVLCTGTSVYRCQLCVCVCVCVCVCDNARF